MNTGHISGSKQANEIPDPPTHDQVTLEIYWCYILCKCNVIKLSLMQNCQDLHNLFGVGKQKLKLKSNKFDCLLAIHECLGWWNRGDRVLIKTTDPFWDEAVVCIVSVLRSNRGHVKSGFVHAHVSRSGSGRRLNFYRRRSKEARLNSTKLNSTSHANSVNVFIGGFQAWRDRR